MNAALRVIVDPPLPGAVNMGRDEGLLAGVGAGAVPPTLRFYQWDPPTISLGYFQRFADYVALPAPAGELAVVRRPTGGGAILHDRELTYSLTVPLAHPLLADGPNRLYELAHAALIEVLGGPASPAQPCGVSDDSGAAKGPFFCFARRHKLDVVVGADKLAGSAQRRTRQAVLQHGSIVLERRFEQQPAAAVHTLTPIAPEALANAMTAAFRRTTGLSFEPGDWLPGELATAEPFIAKHASDAWRQRT